MEKSRRARIDITKTALLIIDMQNDLVKDEKGPFAILVKNVQKGAVIEKISNLLKVAREIGLPIYHIKTVVRADGTDVWPTATSDMRERMPSELITERGKRLIEGTLGADFVDELKPIPREYIVEKRRSDAFYQTPLELFLRRRGIDTLIITGVITSGCVRATAIGATNRDFNIIIASDCCADITKKAHELSIEIDYPRIAKVRTSNEIIADLKDKFNRAKDGEGYAGLS